MTPPCHAFPASHLPQKVQVDVNGRKRKTVDGRGIDLDACELLGMLQYSCVVDRPEIRDSPVRCWPVQRWFRRCQDKKGQFTVETTAWEDAIPPSEAASQNPAAAYVDPWTQSWHSAISHPQHK